MQFQERQCREKGTVFWQNNHNLNPFSCLKLADNYFPKVLISKNKRSFISAMSNIHVYKYKRRSTCYKSYNLQLSKVSQRHICFSHKTNSCKNSVCDNSLNFTVWDFQVIFQVISAKEVNNT